MNVLMVPHGSVGCVGTCSGMANIFTMYFYFLPC